MAKNLIFGGSGNKQKDDENNYDNMSFEDMLDSILNTAAHPEAHQIVDIVLNKEMNEEAREKNSQLLNSFVINSVVETLGHFAPKPQDTESLNNEEQTVKTLELLRTLMEKFLKASKSADIPKEIRQTLLVLAIDAFDVHTAEIANSWRVSKENDWKVKDYTDHYIEALVNLKNLDTAIEKEKTNQPYIPAENTTAKFTAPSLRNFLKSISTKHSVDGHDVKFGDFMQSTMKEYKNDLTDLLQTFNDKTKDIQPERPNLKRRSSSKKI